MKNEKSDLSQSLEDYLEAIYMISKEKKIVRVKDIVTKLNVRSSSVIGALKKLKERGYVNQEHYGYIVLTPSGLKSSEELLKKHKSLYKFFNSILKVNSKIAEKDACAIEHHISEETYSKMMRLIDFIERSSDSGEKWHENLLIFLKTGK